MMWIVVGTLTLWLFVTMAFVFVTVHQLLQVSYERDQLHVQLLRAEWQSAKGDSSP